MSALQALPSAGGLLRVWRQHRRLSQMDLALEAQISTRHLSFVETGRSAPSREMLLRLAECLDVPLRARNDLLNAGGFASVYQERDLAAPQMAKADEVVDLVLRGHEPYPAVAIDRSWTLLRANAAVAPLLAGTAPALLQAPVNVLRLSLHPEGLAPRIENLAEWRAHLLGRLEREIDRSAHPDLVDLRLELRSYGEGPGRMSPDSSQIAVPLLLRVPQREPPLRLITTTTVFGAANTVTVAELALECFYPLDEDTRAWFLASRH